MGLRGPLPEPTKLRIVKGNPSGKPLPEQEPQPNPLATLEPPPELDDVAKDCWRRNVPELDRLGLITTLDREMFVRYCFTYSQWYRMRGVIQQSGQLIPQYKGEGPNRVLVSVQPNPAWYMERSYSQELARMEAHFGMTPSARSRLHMEATDGRRRNGGGDDPDIDPFD